jgi:hypothetical protein
VGDAAVVAVAVAALAAAAMVVVAPRTAVDQAVMAHHEEEDIAAATVPEVDLAIAHTKIMVAVARPIIVDQTVMVHYEEEDIKAATAMTHTSMSGNITEWAENPGVGCVTYFWMYHLGWLDKPISGPLETVLVSIIRGRHRCSSSKLRVFRPFRPRRELVSFQ